MEPYYYSQLNRQQQRVYKVIKNGLNSLEESFEVSRIEKEILSDIFIN